MAGEVEGCSDVPHRAPIRVDTGTAPGGAHHYTIAKGKTRVRVRFMGPYTITYVHAYQVHRPPSFPFGY